MTKEIAIHRLLLVRHRKDNTDLLNEALDMAIEALRKQVRLEELMNLGTEYVNRMYKEGNTDDK